MPSIQYIDLTSVSCLTPLNTNNLLNSLQVEHSLNNIEMSKTFLEKLYETNGWKINKQYDSRRWHYTKQTHETRIHPRKLDMTESGPERMSKSYQYYSYKL